ncbi:MAG: cytochrome-c oxidase, cbb3-type subunit III [Pseudorhodoplanes sp.]
MANERNPIDPVTGVPTTGHEWDGVKELNNPLPRWWLWLFYVTIIWSIGYWIFYPSWPLASNYTIGLFNWHSRQALVNDLQSLTSERAPMTGKLASASLPDILADPQLAGFSRALGKAVFGENCAGCHGAGAGGAKGYPNLLDDDWIWGGKIDDIAQTIRHGIRATDEKTRMGPMPAFGRDGILNRADINAVVDYVRSLAKLQVAANADLAKGKKVFAEQCASCHGEDGKGNRELGALNLTDNIWLYGPSRETIMETVVNGRNGVMPAWAGRLDDTTIKALAVYVHTLGGGEK